MKTAVDLDLARSLPSLLATAAISAASVVALAVVHSFLTGEEGKPSPAKPRVKAIAQVDAKPPAVVPAGKLPAAPAAKQETSAQPPPALPLQPVTEIPLTENSLAQLRADYERERKEFFTAVETYLNESVTAARESTDAKAITRAEAVRDAFAQGIVPNTAPEPALAELLRTREQLASALQQQIQTARGNVSESHLAALEKELNDFLASESADVGNAIHRFPKCVFRLINLETGLALAVKSTGRGAAVIQDKEDPANLLQHWYVTYPDKSYSRVKNRGSKMVLNVPAGNRAGGVKIIQWDDKHSDFSFWELQHRGSYYHVRSRFSGKLLSVAGAEKTEGKQLIQWPYHDAPDDQRWKLIRVLDETEAK